MKNNPILRGLVVLAATALFATTSIASAVDKVEPTISYSVNLMANNVMGWSELPAVMGFDDTNPSLTLGVFNLVKGMSPRTVTVYSDTFAHQLCTFKAEYPANIEGVKITANTIDTSKGSCSVAGTQIAQDTYALDATPTLKVKIIK